MIDLHFHSYYSDGIYSPKILVKKAKKIGFSMLCLTDHNGVDGLDEFAAQAKKEKIKFWLGVEIYTRWQNRHVHLLGYQFDVKNKKLYNALKKLQNDRLLRVKRAIRVLKSRGWIVDDKEIFNTPSSYIGLAHLAEALKKYPENWERIKKDFEWHPGKIITITEIVAKYLFENGKSICQESRISIKEGIELIKGAGGLTVLAHPGQHLSWKDSDLILKFKKMGLDGIEAISSHHTWDGIEHWQKLAKELNLMITVGSDFHGDLPDEWGFAIRSQWEYFRIDKRNFSNF